jgi:hypothetical protein
MDILKEGEPNCALGIIDELTVSISTERSLWWGVLLEPAREERRKGVAGRLDVLQFDWQNRRRCRKNRISICCTLQRPKANHPGSSVCQRLPFVVTISSFSES